MPEMAARSHGRGEGLFDSSRLMHATFVICQTSPPKGSVESMRLRYAHGSHAGVSVVLERCWLGEMSCVCFLLFLVDGLRGWILVLTDAEREGQREVLRRDLDC